MCPVSCHRNMFRVFQGIQRPLRNAENFRWDCSITPGYGRQITLPPLFIFQTQQLAIVFVRLEMLNALRPSRQWDLSVSIAQAAKVPLQKSPLEHVEMLLKVIGAMTGQI